MASHFPAIDFLLSLSPIFKPLFSFVYTKQNYAYFTCLLFSILATNIVILIITVIHGVWVQAMNYSSM